MSWPWRALFGPCLWAAAFSLIYGVHGLGCAQAWTSIATPLGSLHHVILVALWLLSLAGALLILLRVPKGDGHAAEIIRIGGWIGLVATLLTLFPVLGLSTCSPAFALAAPPP